MSDSVVTPRHVPGTHTPGLWTAYYHERRDNWQISTDAFGPRGVVVAFTGSHSVPTQQEANARLIAAAPELLSALQEIYATTQHTGSRDIARTAIARATGQ